MLSTSNAASQGGTTAPAVLLSEAERIALQNLFDRIAERGRRFRERKARMNPAENRVAHSANTLMNTPTQTTEPLG